MSRLGTRFEIPPGGGPGYRCIDRFLALDRVSRVSARIGYRENHGLARGVSQGVGPAAGPGAHREKCVSR